MALHCRHYMEICSAMHESANNHGAFITIGCFWSEFKEVVNGKTVYGDRPHFELYCVNDCPILFEFEK